MSRPRDFVDELKASFEEASRHWEKLLKKKLPALHISYEDHEYGTMVWLRDARLIQLTLTTSMQWVIHVSDRNEAVIKDSTDESVFDAGQEDAAMVKRLRELLKTKS